MDMDMGICNDPPGDAGVMAATVQSSDANGTISLSRENRKHAIEKAAEKPKAILVNECGIPIVLRSLPRWVLWRYVRKNNRWTKPPFQASGAMADSTDPATWTTFGRAMEAYDSGNFDGIGFVLVEDGGYSGIDLDDCRDPSTGEIEPEALAIINRIDSFTDISPSGTGFKILTKGKLTLRGDGTKKISGVEFFDSEKYFTLTGNAMDKATIEDRQDVVDCFHKELFDKKAAKPKFSKPQVGTSSTLMPLSDEQIILRAGNAVNGSKFKNYMAGSWGDKTSASEADMALMSLLAFWTDDADQIMRIMETSGLWRPKLERADYVRRTLAKVLVGERDRYDPHYHNRRNTVSIGKPPAASSQQGTEPGSQHEQSQLPPIEAQSVQLRVVDARKTKSGKITATIAIMKDNVRVDVLTVTSASSARLQTAKTIARHVGLDADMLVIEMALGKAMTIASEMATRPKERAGETLEEIVRRQQEWDFQPKYRMKDGFHSESRGQEIRRQDFITCVTSNLINAAKLACDAPTRESDGEINLASLLGQIKAILEIQFADLMTTLPAATGANLEADSAAGREFRSAMTKVLTMPKTWEAPNPTTGVTQRASLMSRAAEETRGPRRRGWKKVLAACNLSWRKVEVETKDGELEMRVVLGCRWELCHQIGVLVPGVTDQASLVLLGTRYGVIDADPPVSKKMNGGDDRIAVFRHDFIAPLLADADDRPTPKETDTDDQTEG